MSRSFAGQASNGDYIDCGSAALLDDMDPLTILAWIYRTGTGGGGVGTICGKHNAGFSAGLLFYSDGSPLHSYRWTSGTASELKDAASLTADVWTFVGVQHNIAGAAQGKLFKGTPTSPIAEIASYAIQSTPSGSVASDAGESFVIGNNRISSGRTWAGLIGYVYVFEAILTVAEMRAVQQGRIPASAWSSLRAFLPLWGVASPEADLSGNGNNGTVSGATAAGGPPVMPYGAPRRRYANLGNAAVVLTGSSPAFTTAMLGLVGSAPSISMSKLGLSGAQPAMAPAKVVLTGSLPAFGLGIEGFLRTQPAIGLSSLTLSGQVAAYAPALRVMTGAQPAVAPVITQFLSSLPAVGHGKVAFTHAQPACVMSVGPMSGSVACFARSFPDLPITANTVRRVYEPVQLIELTL